MSFGKRMTAEGRRVEEVAWLSGWLTNLELVTQGVSRKRRETAWGQLCRILTAAHLSPSPVPCPLFSGGHVGLGLTCIKPGWGGRDQEGRRAVLAI